MDSEEKLPVNLMDNRYTLSAVVYAVNWKALSWEAVEMEIRMVRE